MLGEGFHFLAMQGSLGLPVPDWHLCLVHMCLAAHPRPRAQSQKSGVLRTLDLRTQGTLQGLLLAPRGDEHVCLQTGANQALHCTECQCGQMWANGGGEGRGENQTHGRHGCC